MPSASFTSSRSCVRRSRRKGANRIPLPSRTSSAAEPCEPPCPPIPNPNAVAASAGASAAGPGGGGGVAAGSTPPPPPAVPPQPPPPCHHPPYDLRRKSPPHHDHSASTSSGGGSTSTAHAHYHHSMLPARKRPRRTCSMSSATSADATPAAHYLQYELPDEVLLTIFGYLLEQDLCRLSQVCKRFQGIANDNELWKNLYHSVYEYDMPLFNREPCRFEFVAADECEYANPWKESFRHLYRGVHVRPGQSQTTATGSSRLRPHFDSIQNALDYVDENIITGGALVFLHRGTYRGEFLVIDSDIAFIGAAPGNVAESVILERELESTLMFVEGAKQAYAGHLTLKFSPDVTSTVSHHKHYCLEVGENCTPTIDHCIIRSSSVVGAAVCVSGVGAAPVIKHCDISDCENVGLYVTDYAQGTYEDNEISRNALAGIWVKNYANPIMRRNHIHHGRDVGIFTFDNGLGFFEANDIHNNRIAGFEVKAGANPTVVHCEIHHGQTGGIYVHENGLGQF
ncbi:F-box only protein 11, partial [Nilaparvata lugens]|uniref:F-box only protein 11 n=1 Tax=Nilaparvata lugens TaxID=108931 RepID=UPI00193EB73C